MGGAAAWAITRFGELCRRLAAKKIIKPKIKSARIISTIMSHNGISPEKRGSPPEDSDAEETCDGWL